VVNQPKKEIVHFQQISYTKNFNHSLIQAVLTARYNAPGDWKPAKNYAALMISGADEEKLFVAVSMHNIAHIVKELFWQMR
jgi:hypothetical protein